LLIYQYICKINQPLKKVLLFQIKSLEIDISDNVLLIIKKDQALFIFIKENTETKFKYLLNTAFN